MQNILHKQLQKVQSHYQALKEYREFIKQIGFGFTSDEFEHLNIQTKAVLEAYLKRFSSLQDYLGAKVFKTLLSVAGVSYTKMSEVVFLIEREEIIDFDSWIEFRNIRNELEHDYPDELQEALNDLKYCVDSFEEMERIVQRVIDFAKRYQ
jgi:hypothetical protein